MVEGKNYHRDADSLHRSPPVSGTSPLAEFISTVCFCILNFNLFFFSITSGEFLETPSPIYSSFSAGQVIWSLISTRPSRVIYAYMLAAENRLMVEIVFGVFVQLFSIIK